MEKAPPSRRRIVTVATEHAAVLDTCEWLEGQGYEVTRLPVGADGLVDLDDVRAAIDETVALVARHAGQQRNRRHPAGRGHRPALRTKPAR